MLPGMTYDDSIRVRLSFSEVEELEKWLKTLVGSDLLTIQEVMACATLANKLDKLVLGAKARKLASELLNQSHTPHGGE